MPRPLNHKTAKRGILLCPILGKISVPLTALARVDPSSGPYSPWPPTGTARHLHLPIDLSGSGCWSSSFLWLVISPPCTSITRTVQGQRHLPSLPAGIRGSDRARQTCGPTRRSQARLLVTQAKWEDIDDMGGCVLPLDQAFSHIPDQSIFWTRT
jgi:hypothetical protein